MKRLLLFLKSPQMFYPTLGFVIVLFLLLVGLYTNSPLNVANWFSKEETKGAETIDNEPPEIIEKTSEETTRPTEEPNDVPEKPEIKPVIILEGQTYSNGVKLTWATRDLSSMKGYKIVRSQEATPVYPGDTYKYISNESQKSYSWEITDGKTYYFRVCQYLGGKCGIYSNSVKVTAPLAERESEEEIAVRSITLRFGSLLSVGSTNLTTQMAVNQQAKVTWSVEGYSKYGFKLVYSRNANPTYPTREADRYAYYSNPSQNYGVVEAFNGTGKYYARVCEYLGGKCGVYSNQIEIIFPENQ